MMRRPGQQVKSLPVIYVTKPFWAGMLARPFPQPPRWSRSVTRFAASTLVGHNRGERPSIGNRVRL